MGTSSPSSPLIRAHPPTNPSICVLVYECVSTGMSVWTCVFVCAFTSSKCNLFLHSGKAPLLLSACQAPSGSWQDGCQHRPSRPVKGTRVSHFPWSRWRCQPDIPITRHPLLTLCPISERSRVGPGTKMLSIKNRHAQAHWLAPALHLWCTGSAFGLQPACLIDSRLHYTHTELQ